MTVEEKVDAVISRILPEILRRLKEYESKVRDTEGVVGRADLESVRQGAMRQVAALSESVQALAARMDKAEDEVENRREETELLNGLSIDTRKQMDEISARVADLRSAVDTLVRAVGTLSEERPRRGRRKRGDGTAASPGSEWSVVRDVAADDSDNADAGVAGSEM